MGLAKGKIKQYNNFDLLFITIRAHLKFKTNELVFEYFEIMDKSILYFKAVNRSIANDLPTVAYARAPLLPPHPEGPPTFHRERYDLSYGNYELCFLCKYNGHIRPVIG